MKNKERFQKGDLVQNAIRTPDGTFLVSTHVHDYHTYLDKNGFQYMVDGGLEYLRRNKIAKAPYTELSIYMGDAYPDVRNKLLRGGRGKDGTQELKWILLSEMSNSHLEATIKYMRKYQKNSPLYGFYMDNYKTELKFRKAMGINIIDAE